MSEYDRKTKFQIFIFIIRTLKTWRDFREQIKPLGICYLCYAIYFEGFLWYFSITGSCYVMKEMFVGIYNNNNIKVCYYESTHGNKKKLPIILIKLFVIVMNNYVKYTITV